MVAVAVTLVHPPQRRWLPGAVVGLLFRPVEPQGQPLLAVGRWESVCLRSLARRVLLNAKGERAVVELHLVPTAPPVPVDRVRDTAGVLQVAAGSPLARR